MPSVVFRQAWVLADNQLSASTQERKLGAQDLTFKTASHL